MAVTTKIKMLVPQGTTYEHTFNYETAAGVAIDLTGYSARMQFRSTVNSSTTLYDVTDVSGELVCGNGTVVLTIPDTASEAFSFTKCVFDIEVESPGGVTTRIVKGTVVVDPEVTR